MITLIIIALTCLTSFLAFRSPQLKKDLIFSPYAVDRLNEYYRFVSSGFIHADWLHLLFNMYVLYEFGQIVEIYYGRHFGDLANILYLVLYFGSMIMADMSTFYRFRNYSHYRGLGASGAVSGVLMVFILFEPWATLQFIFIPGLPIPAIVLGIGYLIYSWYAARQMNDNINHEAHFYGAIFGVLLTLLLKPSLAVDFVQKMLGG